MHACFLSRINNFCKLCYFLYATLLVGYIGAIGIFCFLNRMESNVLELACFFSQIISGFFVIAGTVIAVAQYISNSNIARKEADKHRKMEAAKMADEFRRDVIPLINK